MIPFTCPCCEVSQPPHQDGCTFYADSRDDAADFDEVSVMRVEIARLRESLAIFVHAHATGNSVPPHIESDARALLKEVSSG